MSSPLEDLADIFKSTKQHMKSLKTMEERLIAAQEFRKDCGAKEERVTKSLEKTK
jgi:hypothetical protein